jgi:hypothetical protein
MARTADHTLSLLIAHNRALDIVHRGREVRVRPGEATIIENWQSGSVDSADAYGITGLVLPTEGMNDGAPLYEHAMAQPIARDDGALKLLRGYVGPFDHQTCDHLGAGTAAAAYRDLLDLSHLILSGPHKEAAKARDSSIQAVRLATAIAYIEQHCLEPDLVSGSVAMALGISIR